MARHRPAPKLLYHGAPGDNRCPFPAQAWTRGDSSEACSLSNACARIARLALRRGRTLRASRWIPGTTPLFQRNASNAARLDPATPAWDWLNQVRSLPTDQSFSGRKRTGPATCFAAEARFRGCATKVLEGVYEPARAEV